MQNIYYLPKIIQKTYLEDWCCTYRIFVPFIYRAVL